MVTKDLLVREVITTVSIYFLTYYTKSLVKCYIRKEVISKETD